MHGICEQCERSEQEPAGELDEEEHAVGGERDQQGGAAVVDF
jgi:hypothetical protein